MGKLDGLSKELHSTVKKALIDEAGNVTIKLPVSGLQLSFREPTWGDLDAILVQARSLASMSELSLMMVSAQVLQVGSTLTMDDYRAMNAKDAKEVMLALKPFLSVLSVE